VAKEGFHPALTALTPGADQAKPGAHGNHIVVANHGADRRVASQQRIYRFRRFLLAGFTLNNPFAVERQTVFDQRRAVAADPFGAGQGRTFPPARQCADDRDE
jgi:hypothetical protein